MYDLVDFYDSLPEGSFKESMEKLGAEVLNRAFGPDLTKRSLEALAYVLRHQETWPPNHRFDFGFPLTRHECGTAGCAWGIAQLLWPETIGMHESMGTIGGTMEAFGIESDAAFDIFVSGCGRDAFGDVAPVSATDVATRIDDYLAGRPIRV